MWLWKNLVCHQDNIPNHWEGKNDSISGVRKLGEGGHV